MDRNLLGTALQDMRGTFGRRDVPVLMVGLGLILGITGPYETNEVLRLFARVLYWVAVVSITFALGHFVSSIIKAIWPEWTGLTWVIASSSAIATAVTLFMVSLNTVIFGPMYDGIKEVLTFLVSVLLICVVVQTCVLLLRSNPEDGAEEVKTNLSIEIERAELPAILQRLPPPLRAPLVSISATDHYVSVATEEGSCLILMRFADAMQEAGADGMQVHRSHWVSRTAITTMQRDADKTYLLLIDGSQLPVSRRYLQDLKEAGWLPENQYG